MTRADRWSCASTSACRRSFSSASRTAAPISRSRSATRRGVRDEGDLAAVPNEPRDRAPGRGHGLLDRLAVTVDVALRAGQPVGDSQLGVADRSGEGGLERSRRRRLPEVGHDAGNGAPLDPGLHKGPREAEGDDDDRRAAGDEDGLEGSVARVLDRHAGERDRMRDRRACECDAAGEDRPQRPSGRAACRGEPADADRRERCRRAHGEPDGRRPGSRARRPGASGRGRRCPCSCPSTLGSKKGSRNSARPSAESAASR